MSNSKYSSSPSISDSNVQQKEKNEKLEPQPRINENSSPRLYMKITQVQKSQLLTMVQKNGFTIKEAAKAIGIKYATAKTIIYHQRVKKKGKKNIGTSQCGYTELKTNKISKLKIVSTTANVTYQHEFQISKQCL